MDIWVGRIILAAIMGFILGVSSDRTILSTRTFTITCMVAALLTIVSNEFFRGLGHPYYSDPTRVSAQIVSAIGFIGTGIMWMAGDRDAAKGLSLAANLWVTAIIGMLIGAGLQQAVVLATFLIIMLFYFWDRMIKLKNYLVKVLAENHKIKKGD